MTFLNLNWALQDWRDIQITSSEKINIERPLPDAGKKPFKNLNTSIMKQ
jgi:hypothetical protein